MWHKAAIQNIKRKENEIWGDETDEWMNERERERIQKTVSFNASYNWLDGLIYL
jgi:hypothetical protein